MFTHAPWQYTYKWLPYEIKASKELWQPDTEMDGSTSKKISDM